MTAQGEIQGQATREQDLRSFFGTFNFSGDMVKQAVGSMSGGEKARLVLCMMVWQRPNLLLMDEPTNHLDLATREALSMALNEFEGTVMLVSHDRALLRCGVRRVLDGQSRGGVEPFDGDLDDYQRYLLDEAKRQREAAKRTGNEAATLAPAQAWHSRCLPHLPRLPTKPVVQTRTRAMEEAAAADRGAHAAAQHRAREPRGATQPQRHPMRSWRTGGSSSRRCQQNWRVWKRPG
jgi:ABC-type multidrug transport system ATPase subunit